MSAILHKVTTKYIVGSRPVSNFPCMRAGGMEMTSLITDHKQEVLTKNERKDINGSNAL